jgi:hypothetical protein
MSLNNENNCREISEDKIAACEKTTGLWNGNFPDLNSACMFESVSSRKNISRFQDINMGNESEQYRDAANGLVLFIPGNRQILL